MIVWSHIRGNVDASIRKSDRIIFSGKARGRVDLY